MGDQREPNREAAQKWGTRLWRPIQRLPDPSGFSRPVRWFALGRRALEARIHERELDTQEHHVALDHFHPDRTPYEASGWSFLRRALPPREVDAGDVFVDYGCGKGRVLLEAAAHYPFRRVLGVEIVPALAAVARQNLAKRRHRLRCDDIEVVVADAADWEPPDDVTVAYLYQPFAGETLQRVAGRLTDSLERAPRRLRIVYACALTPEPLLATGRFREVRRTRTHRIAAQAWDLRVYESEPGTLDPART